MSARFSLHIVVGGGAMVKAISFESRNPLFLISSVVVNKQKQKSQQMNKQPN